MADHARCYHPECATEPAITLEGLGIPLCERHAKHIFSELDSKLFKLHVDRFHAQNPSLGTPKQICTACGHGFYNREQTLCIQCRPDGGAS